MNNANKIPCDILRNPKNSKFDKETVIENIDKNKLIAILRGVPKEKLISVAQALYDGGIRLLEVTYTADGSEDYENYEKIKLLVEHFEDRMMIGAGTVLTVEQVQLTKKAGGLFVISPNADKRIIQETCRVGMVSIPGVFTPTEIVDAHNAGADYVKLFPTTAVGPEYIKAITAPLSNIKILAVGGVTVDNIKDYLNCGTCGFGLGSGIVNKTLIEAEDYSSITALAKEYVDALQE